MTCDIQIHSIANALLEWEPIGEISGLADGDAVIEIQPSDDGANSMKVSSDGRSGTLSGNARTNGKCVIKLDPGSPYVDVLANVWQSNRFERGQLTATDVETGKSFAMECATLENLPNMGFGSEAVDSIDFTFLYKSMAMTPGLNSVVQIARG